jgi:hypothetical protein
LINLDFADVKTIMHGMGFAMMGTGIAEGQDRAIEAARRAISSPLLEGACVNGARGVIINVTGGPDLSLVEVSEASSIVQEAADEDANIIFGAVVDPSLKGKVKITVIATGFGPPATSRSMSTPLQTPVDLSHYTDHARMRRGRRSATSASAMDRGPAAHDDRPPGTVRPAHGRLERGCRRACNHRRSGRLGHGHLREGPRRHAKVGRPRRRGSRSRLRVRVRRPGVSAAARGLSCIVVEVNAPGRGGRVDRSTAHENADV